VIVIEVALHELIVVGAPFKRTALPACVAPNPVPEMATWPPTAPVVADTEVITGAGFADVSTETLSKVAVPKVDVPPLVTNKPMYTF
jgi:hypothetical protein